ncbi:hypothetical protein Tco_1016197, partial [Tanacetum coccineum]
MHEASRLRLPKVLTAGGTDCWRSHLMISQDASYKGCMGMHDQTLVRNVEGVTYDTEGDDSFSCRKEITLEMVDGEPELEKLWSREEVEEEKWWSCGGGVVVLVQRLWFRR